MKEKLEKLLENSYNPISNFRVASILVMKDGTEFIGVNVENISLKEGICAEPNAIGAAITAGYKGADFDKLYLLSDSDNYITPCFLCRQLISELFDESMEIICLSKNDNNRTFKVSELCPHVFGEQDQIRKEG